MPSAALREARRAPVGLLETILEFRAYAAAKATYDAADTPDAQQRLRWTPLLLMVKQIDFALAEEALKTAHGPAAHD